jgi:hypothetical protein
MKIALLAMVGLLFGVIGGAVLGVGAGIAWGRILQNLGV